MTKNNVVNKNTVNMTTDAFNNIIKTIGRYHPPNYSKFKKMEYKIELNKKMFINVILGILE